MRARPSGNRDQSRYARKCLVIPGDKNYEDHCISKFVIQEDAGIYQLYDIPLGLKTAA
jgi:hypothetical protein